MNPQATRASGSEPELYARFQHLGMDQRQEVQRGLFHPIELYPPRAFSGLVGRGGLEPPLHAYQAWILTIRRPAVERRKQCLIRLVVPPGLEPGRPQGAADFKSTAAAITPRDQSHSVMPQMSSVIGGSLSPASRARRFSSCIRAQASSILRQSSSVGGGSLSRGASTWVRRSMMVGISSPP